MYSLSKYTLTKGTIKAFGVMRYDDIRILGTPIQILKVLFIHALLLSSAGEKLGLFG